MRKRLFWIVLTTLLTYFFSTGGLMTVNDESQYLLTKAIAERGALTITPYIDESRAG